MLKNLLTSPDVKLQHENELLKKKISRLQKRNEKLNREIEENYRKYHFVPKDHIDQAGQFITERRVTLLRRGKQTRSPKTKSMCSAAIIELEAFIKILGVLFFQNDPEPQRRFVKKYGI